MNHISGKYCRMSQVNLDALIKREDLFIVQNDVVEQEEIPNIPTIRIDSDLSQNAWFFKNLRKPDFQRETSEWKPERVAGLIRSFINGDIIPAVILWHWKGSNFIIDGGHRLSALIAWVQDDYGFGAASKAFFGEENISKDQRKNHEKTKALIDKSSGIGAFSEYDYAIKNPEKVTPEQARSAGILSNRTIQVQWIKAKTSKDAEQSFFRINGEATPIDETEAVMLKSREKPNAIAARAIIHSGSAHKYWKKFKEKQPEIEEIAKAINDYLFDPELDEKTIHFPIGGKPYSSQTLELVFGIVNMINDLDEINFSRKSLLKKDAEEIKPPKDESGDETIKYLNKVKRIVSIINGQDAISLGLSPLVYFYSKKGRFQITAFFAIIHLVNEWEKDRQSHRGTKFQEFSAVREQFEFFLLSYKNFIAQATTNVGSGLKSYLRLAELFSFIIKKLLDNTNPHEIIEEIKTIDKFGFVRVFEAENTYEDNRNPASPKKFPKETVTEGAISLFLASKIACPICGGHATFHNYNSDHIISIRDKGGNGIENWSLVHFYCNANKESIITLKEKIFSI